MIVTGESTGGMGGMGVEGERETENSIRSLPLLYVDDDDDDGGGDEAFGMCL